MPKARHSWIDPDAFRTEADGQELKKLIEDEKKRKLPSDIIKPPQVKEQENG